VDDGPLIVGGAFRFEAELLKDGAPIDGTGHTVVLKMRRGADAAVTRAATVVTVSPLRVRYDGTIADHAEAGRWFREWETTPPGAGALPYKHKRIEYVVEESP
jgi:hypothetical protein